MTTTTKKTTPAISPDAASMTMECYICGGAAVVSGPKKNGYYKVQCPSCPGGMRTEWWPAKTFQALEKKTALKK